MDARWFPPSNRPETSAGPILGSAYLIATTSLILPRHLTFRKYLPVPAVLYLCYYTRTHRLGDLAEDYLIPIDLAWLLIRWVDIAIVHDHERDLRRINDHETGELEIVEEIERLTTWQRFTRSLHLITNCRGVGWNWRVKNIEFVETETRR